MRLKKGIVMLLVMSALLIAIKLNGPLSAYVFAMKQGDAAVLAISRLEPSAQGKASLLEMIQAEAAKKRVAPVDARVDRVWKAIPGYNGLEVDVDRTYRLMLHAPVNEPIRWMYREVAPKVGLDDLGRVPIYKGNPNKPMVALMINVAWGNEYIPFMLQTLKKENVKATFFFDGSWLKKNTTLAKEIQAEGHELSNHAYTHPNMSQLDRNAAFNQIAKTEALLKSTLHVTNHWFAPPSGDFNQMTVDVAAEQGLKTVLWTLDTVDWKHPPAYSIIQKVRTRVEPGSLILMHPTDSSSSALKGIIAAIKGKGLLLGTVSETLSSDRASLVEAQP
ncbi:polysaccharide deacetylase family protein [Paenibacillus sacheonensis]|uniref:Polysaccharide deacetylase family protein n=1 Tax=Paenibacillus sacheonensis TaxID=742054 RepID=A0A7X4YPG4_9BACL|nr:polysaccharide deacetylase family protein [Paenibacillus sacheonensis]MBM7564663.1 putative sporulation protein (polysaccharide deacetylase family) [Paenibacillus sacheonensis]NBC69219.1 polysaccharide deacetylase family protein [Paenibacillus sacheonensis]